MKRRNPIPKLRMFLEHLESNMFNPQKRTASVLESSFPPKEHAQQIISLCTNKGYISWRQDKDNSLNSGYDITLDGLTFLNGLRSIEKEERNQKMQEQLVITNIVLALTAVFTMISQTNIPNKNFGLFIILAFVIWLCIKTIISFFSRG